MLLVKSTHNVPGGVWVKIQETEMTLPFPFFLLVKQEVLYPAWYPHRTRETPDINVTLFNLINLSNIVTLNSINDKSYIRGVTIILFTLLVNK